MGRYYEQCGSCINLNPNEKSGFTYYCKIKKRYMRLEDTCMPGSFFNPSYYEEDRGRDLEALYKRDNPSGTCYITTIMCDILGFPDNYKDLEVMRNFRDNVLQKDSRYLSVLMEYDVIGPQIARNLKNDPNAVNIARTFVKSHIAPVIAFIEGNYYDEAIQKYVEMVNILKNMYGLSIGNNIIDYDYSRGGHGYVFTKNK